MKLSIFINQAVLILSFMVSEVHASDSARSTTSQKSTTSKNKTSTVSDHQINKVGTCPKTLVDSLNDDQGTKLLGTYSKIEETCGNFSLDVPGQVVPRMRYSSTPELYKKNLENTLSKKVSSQLKYQLEGCNQLPPKTQAALATRLYSASLRFDDFNGQIAEQIAYIDNLVPESAKDEYECSELFPSAKNKCPKNFKNICKNKPEDRLNDLAKETSAALVKINNAKKLLESCKSKNFAGAIRLVGERKQSYFIKKCGAEFQLAQFLESKHTWLTSPEFLKSVTIKTSVCSGFGYGRGATGPKICTDPVYKGEKEIKTAIQKQLSDDRKVLIEAHKKSIKDFKCMYSDKVDNSNCNFQDIRKSLVEMGESGRIKLPEATSIEDKTKNIEMEYYLGIEKCSLDAGKYRQTKTDEKTDLAKSIAIEGGTSSKNSPKGSSYWYSGWR